MAKHSNSLSGRYGVPAAALLSANGLSSPSEVRGGMRLVVPVYHADDHAVASAEKDKRKHDRDVAEAGPEKSLKARTKEKEKEEKEKTAKAGKSAKEAEKSASKSGAVAEAKPSKPSESEEGRDRQDADRQPRIGRGANKGAADRRAG